ncbi:MAG: ATP-binding protein, partial [Anaerolineae bacterium]
WFVPLVPLQSVSAIAPTVAQVLGVSFHGPDPPGQQLLRYLREKRLLLVLDNIEHLLEGVDLLIEILRTAPGVRLLATSRVRLNVMGEQVLILRGMNCPELRDGRPLAEEVRGLDSVALFAQSAQRVQPGFDPDAEQLRHVARICQLAQGMPLAILLAAAWVPALTPAEIAVEMERSLDFLAADWRDVPERHHSMRAVLDATREMLTEDERLVFARLSVFRGGFTREAAQAVAGADLRTLISLVDKSLLQRDQSGRYEIHELLRQYGEEKLEETPEEKEGTLDLHAAYYAEFLARKEVDLWRGYLEESLHEIGNIRAAWRHMTAHGNTAEIHKCLHSLWCVYQARGLLQEGAVVFGEAVGALQMEQDEEADEERAAALGLALRMQGYFALWVGRIESGHTLIREGLSILSGLGARRELALAYALDTSTLPLAGTRQLLEKSLQISKELAYYPAMARALEMLSFITLQQGLYPEAERYAQEALAVSRRFDARTDAAFAHASLGHIAFARGDYAAARRSYKESLALFSQIGQGWTVGRLYSHLGDVALAVGDYEKAKECHQHALARYHEAGLYWTEEREAIGGSWGVPVSLQSLGDIALASGDLAEARRCYGLALDAAFGRPEEGLKPHVLLGPTTLLARTGDRERAVEVAVLARHHPVSVEET